MTDRIVAMGSNARRLQGFSLVELMVAMLAGLIVSSAAIAFFMSGVRSNTDYVLATRLTQELRNNMDYVSRELRRAGYDENALNYVALPTSSTARSPFTTLKLEFPGAANSCILYAYDRAGGIAGVVDPVTGERHGLRRMVRNVNGVDVGVMEVADSSATATAPACDGATPDYSIYPPACNAGSGWCALSDPRQLNVTSFMITSTALNVDPVGTAFGTLIRDLAVSISGSPIKDSAVVQTLTNRVRVRAECLHTTSGTAQCDAAP